MTFKWINMDFVHICKTDWCVWRMICSGVSWSFGGSGAVMVGGSCSSHSYLQLLEFLDDVQRRHKAQLCAEASHKAWEASMGLSLSNTDFILRLQWTTLNTTVCELDSGAETPVCWDVLQLSVCFYIALIFMLKWTCVSACPQNWPIFRNYSECLYKMLWDFMPTYKGMCASYIWP